MIYNKLLHQEFQFLTLLKANGVFFFVGIFFFSLIKIVSLFYFYNF